MTSSSFQDNPGKKTVRDNWNTPFLRYIYDTYHLKYRYMGFTGTELIDVKQWKDMIEEVIAFERLSSESDGRSWVKQLRANFKKFGIPGTVYLGNFEEVVTLGKDYDGQVYKQEKVITLYNLDFCDEISSSIETREREKKLLRYEAIRVILQDQRRCYSQTREPSYFVMLLTVRNQIEANKIKELLSSSRNLLAETSSYCSTCNKMKPIPENGFLTGTHAWSLKAFLYNTLVGYFQLPNISAVFFPIIKYMGNTVKSPMFHWMIFCKFGAEENVSPNVIPAQYLEKINSLSVYKDSINIQLEPGEVLNRRQILSSVDWFKQFEHIFISNGRLM